MANKGFLFAIFSRKVKSHAVESQIIFLVWPCLNHLQKKITQLISCKSLMIQSVSLPVQYLRILAGHIYVLSVSAKKKIKKKNAQVIQLLRIFKKIYLREKNILLFKKESTFLLNKKVIFVFYTIFKLDFITQIIYCIYYPQMSVFSSHNFLCSYISL